MAVVSSGRERTNRRDMYPQCLGNIVGSSTNQQDLPDITADCTGLQGSATSQVDTSLLDFSVCTVGDHCSSPSMMVFDKRTTARRCVPLRLRRCSPVAR